MKIEIGTKVIHKLSGLKAFVTRIDKNGYELQTEINHRKFFDSKSSVEYHSKGFSPKCKLGKQVICNISGDEIVGFVVDISIHHTGIITYKVLDYNFEVHSFDERKVTPNKKRLQLEDIFGKNEFGTYAIGEKCYVSRTPLFGEDLTIWNNNGKMDEYKGTTREIKKIIRSMRTIVEIDRWNFHASVIVPLKPLFDGSELKDEYIIKDFLENIKTKPVEEMSPKELKEHYKKQCVSDIEEFLKEFDYDFGDYRLNQYSSTIDLWKHLSVGDMVYIPRIEEFYSQFEARSDGSPKVENSWDNDGEMLGMCGGVFEISEVSSKRCKVKNPKTNFYWNYSSDSFIHITDRKSDYVGEYVTIKPFSEFSKEDIASLGMTKKELKEILEPKGTTKFETISVEGEWFMDIGGKRWKKEWIVSSFDKKTFVDVINEYKFSEYAPIDVSEYDDKWELTYVQYDEVDISEEISVGDSVFILRKEDWGSEKVVPRSDALDELVGTFQVVDEIDEDSIMIKSGDKELWYSFGMFAHITDKITRSKMQMRGETLGLLFKEEKIPKTEKGSFAVRPRLSEEVVDILGDKIRIVDINEDTVKLRNGNVIYKRMISRLGSLDFMGVYLPEIPNAVEKRVKEFEWVEKERKELPPEEKRDLRVKEEILEMIEEFPVLLQGPVGSAKTTIAMEVTKELGLELVVETMTKQTTLSMLMGYKDVNGKYVSSKFRDAYENGKMFLLEEINGGDANVLLSLNTIENGFISFPDKMVKAHKNFRMMATMNEITNTKDFGGRTVLDKSTRDRFHVITVNSTLKDRFCKSSVAYLEVINEKLLSKGVTDEVTQRDLMRFEFLSKKIGAKEAMMKTLIRDKCEFTNLELSDITKQVRKGTKNDY